MCVCVCHSVWVCVCVCVSGANNLRLQQAHEGGEDGCEHGGRHGDGGQVGPRAHRPHGRGAPVCGAMEGLLKCNCRPINSIQFNFLFHFTQSNTIYTISSYLSNQ